MRAIAFHLPQFHPIPENDEWWGRGFTEWTNVVKAKSLFPGHYQPHLPSDLGFYDLRLPESRQAQAELARDYGIDGFCYYHYWFNGRRVLERPVTEIFESGKPDFPFCLCWANENWTRAWDGQEREVLLRQAYSEQDDLNHIRTLLPIFQDQRYIKIDGKPVFLVYRAKRLPDPERTTDIWRREADAAGLPGVFLVRVESFQDETGDPRDLGFDAAVEFQPRWKLLDNLKRCRQQWWQRRRLGTANRAYGDHLIFNYEDLVTEALAMKLPPYPFIRCVCPSWDNTARKKHGGIILQHSSPEQYKRWLTHVIDQTQTGDEMPTHNQKLMFINAWNEWGEGNHLEPCQKWGRAYLEATLEALSYARGAQSSQTVEVTSPATPKRL